MDRRTLTREYKETRQPIGVYCLRNTANGKLLVGSSVNLPAIFNRHRASLKFGGHTNRALQKDWQEHGELAFAFEVLDTLEPPDRLDYDPSDDLRVLEEMWLEKLSPFDERGYNTRAKEK